MEAAVRFSALGLNLLFVALVCSPAWAQSARTDCGAVTDVPMPTTAGPYMKDMNMRDPMPGQMKKDDMMIGDVAKSAAQKEKCMDDVMKSDEKSMDERKK